MSCNSIITGVDNSPIWKYDSSALSLTPCISQATGTVSNVCHLLRSKHLPICYESGIKFFNEWSLRVALPTGLTPLCATLIWFKKRKEITLRTDWEGYIFRALVPLSPDLPEPSKHYKARSNGCEKHNFNRLYPMYKLVRLVYDSTVSKWIT